MDLFPSIFIFRFGKKKDSKTHSIPCPTQIIPSSHNALRKSLALPNRWTGLKKLHPGPGNVFFHFEHKSHGGEWFRWFSGFQFRMDFLGEPAVIFQWVWHSHLPLLDFRAWKHQRKHPPWHSTLHDHHGETHNPPSRPSNNFLGFGPPKNDRKRLRKQALFYG